MAVVSAVSRRAVEALRSVDSEHSASSSRRVVTRSQLRATTFATDEMI
jgi:hypothetical protein